MTKWLWYLGLAILVGGSWIWFAVSNGDAKAVAAQVAAYQERGDMDAEVAQLQAKLQTLEGERTFNGVLLAFLTAGAVGIFFVLQVLPSFAHRLTHAIYDSAEMVERDIMHGARSLLAQGDYQGAITAFREAAAKDSLNRLPWIEIAKIYKDKLNDPGAAVQTIRYALESQEWEMSDAAYLLFRLAELYDEVEGNRASAVAIMRQVIDEFPRTRHSANANHKLREWGISDKPVSVESAENVV